MGLPEFGVHNSADTTIIHELVMEPQHNHVGKLRPVPYDQLVPGMYSTRQFEAEERDVPDVLAAFNTEISNGALTVEGNTDILGYMGNVQHLPMTTMNISSVPADAVELHAAMDFFNEELHTHNVELLNGWGVVIVTEPQQNLKRVDVIISWDSVQMENGKPVLDGNGQPILILDAEGNPIRRINSDHMFIHRDTQYFEAPGA
jgi:hypothetical protein